MDKQYGKILREFANGAIEKYLTTGHERDQETGLDYRGARYYDSDIARFLSVDPLAAKYVSWSTYNYVMGNPVMMIDPSGKGPEDPPTVHQGAGGSKLELPANAKILNKYLDVNEDGKISLDGGKTTLDAKDGDIWRFEVDGRAYGAKYDKNGKFNGYWDAEGNKFTGLSDKVEYESWGNSKSGKFDIQQADAVGFQVEGGFAFLGGMSIYKGSITDYTGNTKSFHGYSGNIGYGFGAGVTFFAVFSQDPNHRFTVNDWAGSGEGWSAGAGPISVGLGGTNGPDKYRVYSFGAAKGGASLWWSGTRTKLDN